MTTYTMREKFEKWLEWYMRDGPEDYLFCDEDMEAAYLRGQRDLIEELNRVKGSRDTDQ